MCYCSFFVFWQANSFWFRFLLTVNKYRQYKPLNSLVTFTNRDSDADYNPISEVGSCDPNLNLTPYSPKSSAQYKNPLVQVAICFVA